MGRPIKIENCMETVSHVWKLISGKNLGNVVTLQATGNHKGDLHAILNTIYCQNYKYNAEGKGWRYFGVSHTGFTGGLTMGAHGITLEVDIFLTKSEDRFRMENKVYLNRFPDGRSEIPGLLKGGPVVPWCFRLNSKIEDVLFELDKNWCVNLFAYGPKGVDWVYDMMIRVREKKRCSFRWAVKVGNAANMWDKVSIILYYHNGPEDVVPEKKKKKQKKQEKNPVVVRPSPSADDLKDAKKEKHKKQKLVKGSDGWRTKKEE